MADKIKMSVFWQLVIKAVVMTAVTIIMAVIAWFYIFEMFGARMP